MTFMIIIILKTSNQNSVLLKKIINLFNKILIRWFQPSILAPTLMGAHIAYLMMSKEPIEKSVTNNFIYLFSSGATLGMQLWKSFIAPTSFKVLPRHMHSLNQSQLFPKHFFLTTLFSYGSLMAYLKMNPFHLWTHNETKYLGGILFAAFGLNALNGAFFGPKSVEYNMREHQIEKLAGEGITTVGSLPKGNSLESNPVKLILDFLISLKLLIFSL